MEAIICSRRGGGGGNSLTITLTTSWTENDDGTFSQTASVEKVTGNDTQPIVVDCYLSGEDIDADVAILEAWLNVNRVDSAAGTLTFVCYSTAPTVAIPVNVNVW